MTSFTRADGPNTEVAHYAKMRVSVIRGPDAGQSIEAAGKVLTIGTAADSDLKLSDDTVSRKHCELHLAETGFRVVDHWSTNGVRYAGVRIQNIVCSTPIELTLGQTTISVEPLAESENRQRLLYDRFYDLLGGSPKMRELFAQLEPLAKSDLSVLIEGETGTGKEVVAESLHRGSPRAAEPFVVFDCGAAQPNLVESELFGHIRGAFTGALDKRQGEFEQANGGTLFLDEIGELPLEMQKKLLRALEKREVKPLGGSAAKPVDIRVLAATNRKLEAEVKAGNFREDLYFRIAVEHVVVPPLRERAEDIPLLVEHFMRCEAPRASVRDVPEHVWEMLASHRWPGNVRELQNSVRRLIVNPERALSHVDRSHEREGSATADAQRTHALEPLRVARRNAVDAFERTYVNDVLQRSVGNIARASALAEVSRPALEKLMSKHDIKARDFRMPD